MGFDDHAVDLDRLLRQTEELRKRAIGSPRWIAEKRAYEYLEQSAEVVAVLKLVRAVQGVNSLRLLCERGLFIDLGAVVRCVNDCDMEVYFLLENYPDSSSNVAKFVKAFFENTIDGFLTPTTEVVPTKKIHSAVVRVLSGSPQQDDTLERIRRIHRAFSGYVHADYAHVMEVYNGHTDSFNLSGVPDAQQRENHMLIVDEIGLSVLNTLAFAARTLGLSDLHREIMEGY